MTLVLSSTSFSLSRTFFEDFLLGGPGIEEMRGGRFFPATVFHHFAICDHFPVELQKSLKLRRRLCFFGCSLPRTSPTIHATANVRNPVFARGFPRAYLAISSRSSALFE